MLKKITASDRNFRIALLAIIGVVYGLTMARSTSFWDCGEFIAASHVFGIPHPPGTPLFVMLGRVVDVLFSWIGTTALRVNALSAVSAMLTCLVVFEIALLLLRRFKISPLAQRALAFMAGSTLAFYDTFWFNAVEAEVYGVSMLFLTLGVWLVLFGEQWRQGVHWNKFILLFVYLSVLALGVHTNSMLAFPFVWLYIGWQKEYLRLGNWKMGLYWAILGLAIFSGVMGVVLHLKLLAGVALLSLVGWTYSKISEAQSVKSVKSANVAQLFAMGIVALSLTVAGNSVQAVMLVRAQVYPEMNQNTPVDFESLTNVIERKQYGSMSMVSRAFWRRAQWGNLLGFSENIGYLGYHLQQLAPAPLGAQVPILSTAHENNWWSWLHGAHRIVGILLFSAVLVGVFTLRKNPQVLLIFGLFATCSLGLAIYVNFADGTRPDSRDAKNFVERMAEIDAKVGANLPALPSAAELSRIIGEWGKQNSSSAAEFLRTPDGQVIKNVVAWQDAARQAGLAMPMPPGPVRREVRERDYFYTPAFVFWAILLSLAVALLLQGRGAFTEKIVISVGLGLWLLPAITHFTLHDRSRDYLPIDYAYNTLMSVPPQGILLTYGDNDTFPLWYAQMVEQIRPDVVVINMSLAQMEWYRADILRKNPQWQVRISDENQRQSMAYQWQSSPVLRSGEDSLWWAGDSVWRPSPAQNFVSDIVSSNWPQIPLSITFNGGLGDLPGGAQQAGQLAPLVGLVRVFGINAAVADSLLVGNLVHNYRYRYLERGDWRYQDATQRTILGYRYLWGEALRRASGEDRQALLNLMQMVN